MYCILIIQFEKYCEKKTYKKYISIMFTNHQYNIVKSGMRIICLCTTVKNYFITNNAR